MLLKELINFNSDFNVEQLSVYSKEKMNNCIFFCIKGIKYNGHDYYEEAINNGANIIVYSDNIDTNFKNVIFLKVKDVNKTLINIAYKFYGINSNEFNNILIGGGYGKRIVSEYLFQILNHFEKTAIISSKNIKYNDIIVDNNYTTLPLFDNLKLLSRFKNNEIKNIVYETSPLNLMLHKLDFLEKTIMIYTGFSKYAIDYKSTVENYFDVYEDFFDNLKESSAIINIDCEYSNELLNSFGLVKYTYGTSESAEYQISDVVLEKDETSFKIKHKNKIYNINTRLIGIENIYYVTSLFIYLKINNVPTDMAITLLSDLKSVPGNYTYLNEFDYDFLIDRAYYIDEIKNLTKFLKKAYRNKKIYVLMSTNRYSDADLKEVLMTITSFAYEIIFTNSDSKDYEDIDTLSKGQELIKNTNCKSIVIEDRKIAIRQSLNLINANDLLVIIGKGDDNFLIVNGEKMPYENDISVLKKAIARYKKEILDEN